MRLSETITKSVQASACALSIWIASNGSGATNTAPERVVSINLCTDQLALMIAEPEQVISVSRMAHDPQSSVMVEKAKQVPTNSSAAEEIYLLAPDLVLAGTYTTAATLNMLTDLGIRVEIFAPAQALSDVPVRIAQMGKALGRETTAREIIDLFEAELERLSDAPEDNRFRAALTYVNSFSPGRDTLAGDILDVAGFANVAEEYGVSSVGTLTLEDLILLAPDVIIQGRDYPGRARAEDNFSHPALRALSGTKLAGELTDRDWICGTPHVLGALAAMRALRLELEASR